MTMSKALTLLLVLLVGAAFAHADTWTGTFEGISFTAEITASTVTLTVDPSGCTYTNCAYLGGVSIQGWTSFTSYSDGGGTSTGWDDPVQGKVSGPNNCNTSGAPSICWAATNDEAQLISGGPYTFTATLTGGVLADEVSVQAAFYKASTISGPNQVGQISENLTRQVPEPSAMMLLGTGLFGIIGVRRLRLGRH